MKARRHREHLLARASRASRRPPHGADRKREKTLAPDPALIRTQTPYVRERLAARGIHLDIEADLADDAAPRETCAEAERLRGERTTVARAVAALDPGDPVAEKLVPGLPRRVAEPAPPSSPA